MSKIVIPQMSKEESINQCKEAYKQVLLTFVKLKRGEFTAQELTEFLKEIHEELEAQNFQIIKGSLNEYDKYPLYPLLSNS